MAQQIFYLNIRKTHNKQYILPNKPSEQDDRSQHPITSDYIPKLPIRTSQEGEEAGKFIHQTLGTQINESDYLLSNTPKHDTNRDNNTSQNSPDKGILSPQQTQKIMLTYR